MFRSLFAEFLADAASLLDDHRLAGAADTAGELAESWRRLARCARAGDHDAGLRELAGIVSGEHRLVAELERWSARRPA